MPASTMEISNYPELKELILSLVQLTKDAVHIYVGFLCLLVSVIILRRSLASYSALILGLIVSCIMEIFDLRHNLIVTGSLHLAGSLHDLINTNMIPFLLVLLTRWRWLKTSST